MPVVKSTKTHFESEPFVVRVRFSSRSGSFAITLPKAIEQLMGVGEITSDTLKGVEAKYKSILKEYRDSQTTERKVIVYKVEGNARVFRRPDGTPGHTHDDDASVLFEANDISFADGCGLTIFAQVMMERTLRSGDNESYISYEAVEDTSLPGSLDSADHRVADQFGTTEGVLVVDWIPEREAWFAHVGSQLEDLVMKVCKTLGDPEVALQLIDSGRLLMAPVGQGKPVRSSKKRGGKRR